MSVLHGLLRFGLRYMRGLFRLGRARLRGLSTLGLLGRLLSARNVRVLLSLCLSVELFRIVRTRGSRSLLGALHRRFSVLLS